VPIIVTKAELARAWDSSKVSRIFFALQVGLRGTFSSGVLPVEHQQQWHQEENESNLLEPVQELEHACLRNALQTRIVHILQPKLNRRLGELLKVVI
jgi:hypothetical protein